MRNEISTAMMIIVSTMMVIILGLCSFVYIAVTSDNEIALCSDINCDYVCREHPMCHNKQSDTKKRAGLTYD